MTDPAERQDGGLGALVRGAIADFAQLVQQTPERVSGIRKVDGGWSVLVDVLELERVPDTTSVLATYRVDLDGNGELQGYERLRRFTRGATDQS